MNATDILKIAEAGQPEEIRQAKEAAGRIIKANDDEILEDYDKLSPQGMERLRRKLGIPRPVEFHQEQLDNEDVRINVLAHGEVERDKGFAPVPPLEIVMLEEEMPGAVDLWKELWTRGIQATKDMLMDENRDMSYSNIALDEDTLRLMGPDYAQVTKPEHLTTKVAHVEGESAMLTSE